MKESRSIIISVPDDAYISEIVLMPGDPRRAEFIAGKYLKNAVCFNTVRNMSGYTGEYKGQMISVMGSGMGIPSMSIYANDLFDEFGVKAIIRVGSAGGLAPDVRVRDIIIAMAASSDSAFSNIYNVPGQYAACADYNLLKLAEEAAERLNLPTEIGKVFTSDHFSYPDSRIMQNLAALGHLGVDMETAGLYWIAAAKNKQALSLLTVSNHLISGESLDPLSMEQSFCGMAEIALDTAAAWLS